jgi:hypothetical protein
MMNQSENDQSVSNQPVPENCKFCGTNITDGDCEGCNYTTVREVADTLSGTIDLLLTERDQLRKKVGELLAENMRIIEERDKLQSKLETMCVTVCVADDIRNGADDSISSGQNEGGEA